MITSIITTFSTAIGVSKITLDDSIIDFIKNLEYRRVENNNGYISTSLNLLNNHELVDLKKSIIDSVRSYANNILKVSEDCRFDLTTSWANKHSTTDFSQEHDHVNSLFSGILFVDIPEDSGNSIFYNPNPNLGLSLEFNYTDYNQYNSNKIEMKPTAGDLLIFPSSLKHSVTKNTSIDDRYTIAFNVFATGQFGSHERSLVV
jgi:uncharacterized protein (TIGR02466 family)